MSDGYIGLFKRPLYPDPVLGVSFNEVGDSLEVTWNIVPSGVSSEYEVWSSVGDLNNFNIIATISTIEIYSGLNTITIVDQSYNSATTVYYRLYHKSTGHYSDVLASGITLTYTVPDPTNLGVAVGMNQIALSWTNDESRLLESVSVVHMAASGQELLVEVSGAEVFNGLAGGYTHEVPTLELDYWHQFWVSSITRTPSGLESTLQTGGSLDVDTTYYYIVMAFDAYDCSPNAQTNYWLCFHSPISEESSFTTSGTELSALINWANVDGATNYQILISETSGNYTNSRMYGTVAENLGTISDGGTGYTVTALGTDTWAHHSCQIVNNLPNNLNKDLGIIDVALSGTETHDLKDLYDAIVSAGFSDYVYYDGVQFTLKGSITSTGTDAG